MKQKIYLFRKKIPISIIEAIKYLKLTNGNLEEAINLYKKESINKLQEITTKNKLFIKNLFEENKFDYNKTLNILQRKKIPSKQKISSHEFNLIFDWIKYIDHEGISASLSCYDDIEYIIEFITSRLGMLEVGEAIKRARNIELIYLNGINYDTDRENYIKKDDQLRSDPNYLKLTSFIELKLDSVYERLLD